MNRAFDTVCKISLLVLVLTGITMLVGYGDSARAQDCGIGIAKQAEGAGDLVFRFTTRDSEGDGDFTLIDGEGTGGPFTGFIEIRELPIKGWVLDDVQCKTDGVTVTRLSDGVRIECDEQNGGGGCLFINVPGDTASNIPTLSEWGMIAAAAGLMIVGVFFAFKRKRAQAV